MTRPSQITSICLATTVWLGFASARAQTLTNDVVKKAAMPLVNNGKVQGISVGFLEEEHYGIVHLGKTKKDGKPANNQTMYELGSLSKVFTSLLLADAVVRREIRLEDAVDVTNRAQMKMPSHQGRSIQWLDLSTHRSGLPRLPGNLQAFSLQNPYRSYDANKAAAALNSLSLSARPGSKQEYSNFGVSVLGYLIAENAGSTYQELLRDRIALPLGMSDCTVELTEEQKSRFAIPHTAQGRATKVWTFADLPGAGGVRATMRDMMRFAKAQLQPESTPLNQAIQLAWRQHTGPNGNESAMGLGWMIWPDGVTRWHNGQTGGSHTAMFVNRGLKSAIVILCNSAVSDEVDALAIQLLQNVADRAAGKSADQGRTTEKSPPKVSPFTNVQWKGQDAWVTFRGRDYRWMALNGISVEAMTKSAKQQFAGQWQKRIREDLVEVLWGMGHKPGDTVSLLLLDPKTNSDVVVERAPMTKQNRDAVRSASEKGETESQLINAKLRARLEGRYQLAPNFIFDVKDRNGHLMVGITNQPTQEVFPDSATRWSYRSVEATLEFKLGRTGPARQLILHQNGIAQTARRIGR